MANRFFIVEDHHLMSHGITSFLTNNSHWICSGTANNIEDTLEQLRQLYSQKENYPSLLITDINLGTTSEDYSGIELIKCINSNFPDIKCICYSMYKSPGIINMAMTTGAKGYISKSANEKELIECMNIVQNRGNLYRKKSSFINKNVRRCYFFTHTKRNENIELNA